MKKSIQLTIISSLLMMFTTINPFSQNLVGNAEFEDTSDCPSGLEHLFMATGWSSYRGTPDYFNTCSYNMFANAPSNFFGYQVPASGNAYASFYAYYTTYEYREYVGRLLETPLVPGTKYFVSFKVALANTYDYRRTCNNIGVRFSSQLYWDTYPGPMDNFAHVYNSGIISDTANWTLVSGSFTADSAYSHIMIGNFFTDSASTSMGNADQYAAYYFLDDVCVSTDSAFCYQYVGQEPTTPTQVFDIYPNPSTGMVYINAPQMNSFELAIYSLNGELLLINPNQSSASMLDLSALKNGVYLISIVISEQRFFKKLIISR